MAAGRPFGTIVKRGSRYRAAYQCAETGGRQVSRSFDTKHEARDWLNDESLRIRRGEWVDPRGGKTTFTVFAERWYEATTDRRPKTRSSYRYLLDKYLLPEFGAVPLSGITTGQIRSWLGRLSGGEAPTSIPPRAYKLLRHLLNVAFEDGLLWRNPCTIKGAGKEVWTSREPVPIDHVLAIADRIDHRYRALILLAAFGGLRFGELAGLRRQDVNLLHGKLTVRHQAGELDDGTIGLAAPKTSAGVRTIALPTQLVAVLEEHFTSLADRLDSSPDGLVFPAPDGGFLRRSNFRQRFWSPTLKALKLPNYHFHDLRHTAGTLIAQNTSSPADIQHRLGHGSIRASVRYLHATTERDAEVARRLDTALPPLRARS